MNKDFTKYFLKDMQFLPFLVSYSEEKARTVKNIVVNTLYTLQVVQPTVIGIRQHTPVLHDQLPSYAGM